MNDVTFPAGGRRLIAAHEREGIVGLAERLGPAEGPRSCVGSTRR
jgi:hypothetical protein